MKKLSKTTKLLAFATVLSLALASLATPVFAEGDSDCVKTNLFGEVCGEDGIYLILNVVLTVLTFGVGILGTLGIVIAGIQYATATDNAQQIAKAKARIAQIVIGLAIWGTLYVFLSWLIPGGLFHGS